MPAEPIILNPIGWAQLQLYGGWRRQLALCSAYAGAALLICVLVYRAIRNEVDLPTFAGGAVTVFLVIQTAILFFVGTSAIKRAVQRDFTTDMITSHRLTAMSGHTAVIGYLTGATVQATALCLTNWLICTILALMAKPGPANSAFAPTALLIVSSCMALLCWTLSALVALSTRGRMAIIGLLVILGMLTNANVVNLLPGLALVLPGSAVQFIRSAAVVGVSETHIFVGMIAQLSLSLAFFLAAARKFTRDDVPAFNAPLAYALLSLCALIAAAGFIVVPRPASFIFPPTFFRADIQFTTTLTALALIAFLPVGSAAKASAAWARRKSIDPHYTAARPRSYFKAAFLSSLLALGILAITLRGRIEGLFSGQVSLPAAFEPRGLAVVAAIFFLTLVTLGGLLRFIYGAMAGATWMLVLYLVLAWAIPPFADLSLEVVLDRAPGARSMLFACSPVGAWIDLFVGLDAPLIPGVIVQAILAVGAIALASRSKDVRRLRVEGSGARGG